jgi:Kef-type K+ transport system membrane component KefB
MSSLFYLAILLLGGVFFGRLVKYLKLPNVTGYIICGLIIGPYVLNIVPKQAISSFEIFSDVALGFIAFTIGCEFKGSYLKKVGSTPIVIALFEAVCAVILVTTALYLFTKDIKFSLMLGSIAAATAPAATILIIRQYKAKGPVTQMLMSVVALDDAVAIICFGIATAITKYLSNTNASVLINILTPVYEIAVSLGIGVALGFLFMLPLKLFKKKSNRTCLLIGFVFICIAVGKIVEGSSLLACMAFGTTYINLDKKSADVQDILDAITPPIFIIFFVESGAQFDLNIITSLGWVAAIYMILRVIGKIGGSYTGASLMKASPEIRKYLGYTLIPQAGVEIGLALLCVQQFPAFGEKVRAVILCATLVYEIIGPLVCKIALQKAKEINIQKRIKKVTA